MGKPKFNADNNDLNVNDKQKVKTLRGKNQKRSEIRHFSAESKNVLRSLQTCSIRENLSVIENHIRKRQGNPELLDHLRGLKAVLQELLASTVEVNGTERIKSFMSFEEAFTLFLGYTKYATAMTQKSVTERKRFRELLCHPDFGLCIYLVTIRDFRGVYIKELIVLRPDEADFGGFLEEITNPNHISNAAGKNSLSRDLIQTLISNMDSEWDKKVLRFVIITGRSRKEISNLGFDGDNVTSLTEEVLRIAQERENASIAAHDMVNLRLREKIKNLEEKISFKTKYLSVKCVNFTEDQQKDVEEEIQILQEQKESLEKLTRLNSLEDKQKINQMVRRTQQNIIKEERLGLRRKGAGRKAMLDSEDENFLLHCIETKSTAHGRRHDEVMYVGHRIKKKDFLRLINHSLRSRGKSTVKSATTVLNRARPKNIRSVQSKHHLGQGLFCCKKPPKSENIENELTHYQRAFKKNIVRHFFSGSQREHAMYTFVTSDDDKAYVCPGTSTGVKSARNLVIYQPSNDEQARKLPKYDFPISMMNVTPGTHRIMKKEVHEVDGKEEIKTFDEQTFVYLRSKYFVGSSGSVWASEFIDIIQKQPHLFEVKGTGSSLCSSEFKQIIRLVQFAILLFTEVTDKEEITCIEPSNEQCAFRAYELQRINKLLNRLEDARVLFDIYKAKMSLTEKEKVGLLLSTKLDKISIKLKEVVENLNEHGKNILEILDMYEDLSKLLMPALHSIDSFHLPVLKTRAIEFTDAGPGVGVGNFEVRIRAAQRVKILDLDYLMRHHLAPGDSSNEVERVQSLVGDAIVDGGAIPWEYRQRQPIDELDAYSIQELEEIEIERTSYNVKMVCKNLEGRINGSPGPDGTYLKAFTTPSLSELFFDDSDFLKTYSNATRLAKEKIPGHNYYRKLEEFVLTHFEIGEKYMEYTKCSDIANECQFCKDHPVRGPPVTLVPKPYPDHSLLPEYHYLHSSVTPLTTDGEKREIDDFQPRIQLKRALRNGSLDISDEESVLQFCDKYLIEKELLLKCTEHFLYTELMKKKREQVKKIARENEIEKAYVDFNWDDLVETGALKQLLVSSLNKYLTFHGLNKEKNLKKGDKLKFITTHILAKNFAANSSHVNIKKKSILEQTPNSDSDEELSSSGEDEFSDEDDIFALVAENEGNDDVTNTETDFNAAGLVTTTRSGRSVWTWSK